MSSVTPSATSTIDLNDPRLHTLQNPRPTLKRITADMVDELHALTLDAAAESIATCGHHGVVHQRNLSQGRARAYRIVCHKWIDDYCGRPGNLLRVWLRKRNPEMLSTPQSGLEIIGPDSATTEKAANKTVAYFRRLGVDSVQRANAVGDRIRIVLKTRTISLSKIRERLPEVRIELRHDPQPSATLVWMFASTAEVLRIADGRKRARLFAAWRGKRMLKTTGTFYGVYKPQPGESRTAVRELTQEEIDSGWEDVPIEEQFTQTVEQIESEWKVEWSSSYDPFYLRRVVSNMVGHIANHGGHTMRWTDLTAATPSPPS